MSLQQIQREAIERRHRLFNPPNAVPDHPLTMRNGRPVTATARIVVELFPVKQNIHTPVDTGQFLQSNRHDRWPRYFPPQESFRITGALIKRHVARHFNITVPELESNRRTKRIVHIRHIAMYLAKNLTSLSLPGIGKALGGRDHTTVIHGVRKITAARSTNPELSALLDQLTREIET